MSVKSNNLAGNTGMSKPVVEKQQPVTGSSRSRSSALRSDAWRGHARHPYRPQPFLVSIRRLVAGY